MPSEAEWEKAAKGTRGRIYPWGNQGPDEKRCNNFDISIGDTTPVGKYSPAGDSPYGCADMSGNVWEWVEDWYDNDYYEVSPRSNPGGPDSGENKVFRGGSWDNLTVGIRSAYRSWGSPTLTDLDIGFRCALS